MMNDLQMQAPSYRLEQCANSDYPVALLVVGNDTLRHDDNKRITTSDLINVGMHIEQAVKACYEISELFDSIKLKLRNVR